MRRTIEIEILWEDKNYSCGMGFPELGAIFCTNKKLEALKTDFEETLKWHIEEMVKEGEEIPEFLANGDYEIVYTYSTSALLRKAEEFTTIAAISRASGINQKLLGHYACNTKKPKAEQRQKIIAGIHKIGKECLSVC